MLNGQRSPLTGGRSELDSSVPNWSDVPRAKHRNRPQRGTRHIDGRFYMLFVCLQWDPWSAEAEESLAREVAAVKAKITRGEYHYYRVIRSKRRLKAWVYVL